MSWNTTQHFKIMKYTYINLIIRTKPKKKANSCSFTAKTVKIRTTQHFKLMKYTYINLIITTKPKKFKEQPINWKQQETRTRNSKKKKAKKKLHVVGYLRGSWRVQCCSVAAAPVCRRRLKLRRAAADATMCRRQLLRYGCENRVCEGMGFMGFWIAREMGIVREEVLIWEGNENKNY